MNWRGYGNPVCKLFLQCVKSVYRPETRPDHLFLLDITGKLHILCPMKTTYRKRIAWFMLSLLLMLSPVPLWNNGNMVLCIGDACADCHGSIAFAPQENHCEPASDAWGESCGSEARISDALQEECFCCVDIPISTHIEKNTPSPRSHHSSGGIQNVLAPSLPDHPLLNKTLFPSSPNPYLISTQKALRSVVLII